MNPICRCRRHDRQRKSPLLEPWTTMPAKPAAHHRRPLRVWFKEGLISIFLPVGFPDSVTDDFVRYPLPHSVFVNLDFASLTCCKTSPGCPPSPFPLIQVKQLFSWPTEQSSKVSLLTPSC